jgi:CTP synthase (UTP-ammonia lyase)
MIRVALIGDQRESVTAHRAIPIALRLAAEALQCEVAPEWHHTSTLGTPVAAKLNEYAGIWCVPGSPYADTAAALAAIGFARREGRAYLGTCGGFQHALLEYAREVWGVQAAAHAELEPDADDPVIAPLECALIEVRERLQLTPGTRLAQAYGTSTVTEGYHCRFGLSPRYAARLKQGPLRVAARDGAGAVRAVELESHPFFVATLFQPERAALENRAPPLVTAFVRAMISCRDSARPRAGS